MSLRAAGQVTRWLRKTKRRKNNDFNENETLFYSRLGKMNETVGNLPDVESFTKF